MNISVDECLVDIADVGICAQQPFVFRCALLASNVFMCLGQETTDYKQQGFLRRET